MLFVGCLVVGLITSWLDYCDQKASCSRKIRNYLKANDQTMANCSLEIRWVIHWTTSFLKRINSRSFHLNYWTKGHVNDNEQR